MVGTIEKFFNGGSRKAGKRYYMIGFLQMQ